MSRFAAASNAVILGFNVDVDQNTKHMAEAEGVSIRVQIIYRLLEDVEKAFKGFLEPEYGKSYWHGAGIGNFQGF